MIAVLLLVNIAVASAFVASNRPSAARMVMSDMVSINSLLKFTMLITRPIDRRIR